jgi:dTMP kinase
MDAIVEAKNGNLLGKTTLSLLYATDLADQLENRIIPAMRAGFVAVADRYIYTLMARDLMRGASPKWVKDLFGFALVPDLIFFLDAEPELLLHRAFAKYGRLDYWESGMDLGIGGDMLESFEKYQTGHRKHFNRLAEEYGFDVIDAGPDPDTIQSHIRKKVETYLNREPRKKAGKEDRA